MIKPYNPNTSAKIKIKTIPTNNRGWCIYWRTPSSPTMPMAYPEAMQAKPTDSPQAKCIIPLNKEYSSVGFKPPAINTETTSPYTDKIPDKTTGISDFMIKSGLKVPIPAIPMPDLAEPMAAPTQEKTMEAAQPARPKKGAKRGLSSSLVLMFVVSGRNGGFEVANEMARSTGGRARPSVGLVRGIVRWSC